MHPHSLLPPTLWQLLTCFVTLLALELTGCCTWANPASISGVVTGEPISQGYSFPCHLPAMNALTSGLSFGGFIHLSRTPESSHFWVSLCPHEAATVLIFHHGKSHLLPQITGKHPLRQDIHTCPQGPSPQRPSKWLRWVKRASSGPWGGRAGIFNKRASFNWWLPCQNSGLLIYQERL